MQRVGFIDSQDYEDIQDWLYTVPSSNKPEKRGTDPRRHLEPRITLQQQDNSGLAQVVWAAKAMKKSEPDDTLVSFGPSQGRPEGSIQQSINGASLYPPQRSTSIYQSSRNLPVVSSAMNIAYEEDQSPTKGGSYFSKSGEKSQLFRKESTKALAGKTAFNTTKRNLFDNIQPTKSSSSSTGNLFTSKSLNQKAQSSSGILRQNQSFLSKTTGKKTVSWGPTTVTDQKSLFKKPTGFMSSSTSQTPTQPQTTLFASQQTSSKPLSMFSSASQNLGTQQTGLLSQHGSHYMKGDHMKSLEEKAKMLSMEMRKQQNMKDGSEQQKGAKQKRDLNDEEVAKSLSTMLKIAKQKVERSHKRAARDYSVHKEKLFKPQFTEEILPLKKKNPSYTGSKYKAKRDLSLRWKFWNEELPRGSSPYQIPGETTSIQKAYQISQKLIEREKRIPIQRVSDIEAQENEQSIKESIIHSFLRNNKANQSFTKEKLICSDQLKVRVQIRQFNKLLDTIQLMLHKDALLTHVQEAIQMEIERHDLLHKPWQFISLSRQGRQLRGSSLKKAGVKNNNEIIVAYICSYDEETHELEQEEESDEAEQVVWKPVLNPALQYSPSRSTLNSMSKTQLRKVANLVIQDPRYGRIQYLEPVDLVLTNHIRDLYFTEGQIDVYPKYKHKPENYKLNKPCDFYLYQFKLEEYETIEEFEAECRENCAEINVRKVIKQIEYYGLEEEEEGRIVVHMRCQSW